MQAPRHGQELLGRGITIEDVAKAAAVSRQTVSRVINHSPRVSPEARARVEQAIAALSYVPSLAARSMAGGRSRMLLAVFENAMTTAHGSLRLDRLLLAGTKVCSAHDYRLLFEPLAADLSDAEAAAQLVATLGAVQPDGAILLPPLDTRAELRAALASRRIAAETLWGADDPPANPGEAAAQHLLGLGHRQIGFITGRGDPHWSQQCVAGYRRALAQKGSRAHRHFVTEDQPDLTGVLDLAHSWLMPTIRPTAIIAERAEAALAVLHVAGALKLAVPRDLSLLVLEDDPALARCEPPIAVLHQPVAAQFAAACERLIGTHETNEAAPRHERTDAPGLDFIERPSLARAPRAI